MTLVILTCGIDFSVGPLVAVLNCRHSSSRPPLHRQLRDRVPMPVVVMLIVYVVMWFVLERTTFGRHVYAIDGGPDGRGTCVGPARTG